MSFGNNRFGREIQQQSLLPSWRASISTAPTPVAAAAVATWATTAWATTTAAAAAAIVLGGFFNGPPLEHSLA